MAYKCQMSYNCQMSNVMECHGRSNVMANGKSSKSKISNVKYQMYFAKSVDLVRYQYILR